MDLIKKELEYEDNSIELNFVEVKIGDIIQGELVKNHFPLYKISH